MTQASNPRRLFGQIAILAGFATDEQVDECVKLQQQVRKNKGGAHVYIGAIMVGKEYLTKEQVLQILYHQQVQIVEDPTTNKRYNIHNFNEKKKYRSPEGDSLLYVPDEIDNLMVRGDLGLKKVTRAKAEDPISDEERANFVLATPPVSEAAASPDEAAWGLDEPSAAVPSPSDDPFGEADAGATGGPFGDAPAAADPGGFDDPAPSDALPADGWDSADPFASPEGEADPFGETLTDSPLNPGGEAFGGAETGQGDGWGGTEEDAFAAGGAPEGDPFASSPGGDPFGSEQGDPFGDASAGATAGGDWGNEDPFGDAASAPPDPAGADDPFGDGLSDDPFASATQTEGKVDDMGDPFATAAGDQPFGDGYAATEHDAGTFGDDPFGTAAATPAAGDDPFGAAAEDPFASASNADNPFDDTPSPTEPFGSPFEAGAEADPFGGGGIDDPFGSTPDFGAGPTEESNPFGAGEEQDDEWGAEDEWSGSTHEPFDSSGHDASATEVDADVAGALGGAVVEDLDKERDATGGPVGTEDMPALGGTVVEDTGEGAGAAAAPADEYAGTDSWMTHTAAGHDSPARINEPDDDGSGFGATIQAPTAAAAAAQPAEPAKPKEEETDVDVQVQAKAAEEKTDRSLAVAGKGFSGRGSGEFQAQPRSSLGRALAATVGLVVLVAGIVAITNPQLIGLDSAGDEPAPNGDDTAAEPPDSLLERLAAARTMATEQEQYMEAIRDLTDLRQSLTYRDHNEMIDETITEIRAALDARIEEAQANLIRMRDQVRVARTREDRDQAAVLIEQLEAQLADYRERGFEIDQEIANRIGGTIEEVSLWLDEPPADMWSVQRFVRETNELLQTVPQHQQWQRAIAQLAEGEDRLRNQLALWQRAPERAEALAHFGRLLVSLGRYRQSLQSAFENWWQAEDDEELEPDYLASYEALVRAEEHLQAIAATPDPDTERTPFEVPVEFVIETREGLLIPWAETVFADAEEQLRLMQEDPELRVDPAASRAAKERMEEYLGLVEQFDLPQVGEQEPAAMIAVAEEAIRRAGSRANLADNVAALEEELSEEAPDWTRVRRMSLQILDATEDALDPQDVAQERGLAEWALPRAEWHIAVESGEAPFENAIAANDDPGVSIEERVEQWEELADLYVSLLVEGMWQEDGRPHPYTAEQPWELRHGDKQQGYEMRNRVTERALIAPAWRGYWRGQHRLERAEALFADEATRDEARELYRNAEADLSRAADVFATQAQLRDHVPEIREMRFRAETEPARRLVDFYLQAAEEAGQAGEFVEAIEALDNAGNRVDWLIPRYEREGRDDPELLELIGVIAEQKETYGAMSHRMEVSLALRDGELIESEAIEFLMDDATDLVEIRFELISLRERYEEAQRIAGTIREASLDPQERRRTVRQAELLRARQARLETLSQLVDATIAINEGSRSGLRNAREALTALQQRPNLDSRMRHAAGLLYHAATRSERIEQNRRNMVLVEGSDGQTVTLTDIDGQPLETEVESYYLDRAEVTNGQYREFLEWLESVGYDDSTVRHPDQPADYDSRHVPRFWNVRAPEFDELPVVGVTFWDAYAYAQWAGKRLPEASEWEWAARNRFDENAYPWADGPASGLANSRENQGASFFGLMPARSLEDGANPLGLLHMAGNALEWTASQALDGESRVLKGGSFLTPLADMQNNRIYTRRPNFYNDRIGFRCAMDVDAE